MLLLLFSASIFSFCCAAPSTLRAALAAASAPPTILLFYNASYIYAPSTASAAGFEEVSLIAALAGHANRFSPTLLLNLEPADAPWLARMAAPGAWLANTTLTPIPPPVENLITALLAPAGIRGIALYDPAAPCTSAVAATAAGAGDLLPVAFRPADPTSLYSRIVAGGLRLPVVVNLVGKFNGTAKGSVKREAYEWATDEYIKTGRVDAAHLAYYVDYFWALTPSNTENGGGWAKATLPNADFAVARRGFFFDLGVWEDEAPVDEPGQPLGSDLLALRYILQAAAAQTGGAILRMHGFTPWAYKYVKPNGKHGGVEAEWATGKIVSSYNVMVDADACCIGNMANAALWSLHPLKTRYVQPPPPSKAWLTERGLLDAAGGVVGHKLFYMFYAGDFDSAAWLYSQFMERWDDPARGTVQIGWGVDPGLADRFPPIFSLLFDSMNAGFDNIISGDSGAGYLNPTMLRGPARANESGLPDGTGAWVALNTALNRQFNIRFTGFSISGDAPLPSDADDAIFANFSSYGVVNQGWPSLHPHLNKNLPVLTQWDIPADPAAAAATVASYAKPAQEAPTFMMFRSVLTSPTFLGEVAGKAEAASQGAAVAVTPMELSALMRVALGGSNDNSVTYFDDTLPEVVQWGEEVKFNVSIRNDGWSMLTGRGGGHGVWVGVVGLERVVMKRGLSMESET